MSPLGQKSKDLTQLPTFTKLKKSLTPKTILTALAGGALLLFAYKKRSSRLAQLAGVAGSSLLGQSLKDSGLSK